MGAGTKPKNPTLAFGQEQLEKGRVGKEAEGTERDWKGSQEPQRDSSCWGYPVTFRPWRSQKLLGQSLPLAPPVASGHCGRARGVWGGGATVAGYHPAGACRSTE